MIRFEYYLSFGFKSNSDYSKVNQILRIIQIQYQIILVDISLATFAK